MDPKAEFKDLYARLKKLGVVNLLVVAISLQVLVQVAHLFCTVWVVWIMHIRGIVERKTDKLAVKDVWELL